MSATTLRIATYNVHKCRGLDRRVSVERIRDVIAAVAPGILAVQEITAPQAEQLSQWLAMRHVFGEARKLRGEGYGNAVFSSLSMLEHQNYNLTVLGREPRQCLRATLHIPQRQAVQFFAVHLGTSPFERRRQAVRLASPEVLENPSYTGHRIVAGDFNDWTRGLATRMLSRVLISADHQKHLRSGVTYPALAPFLHLDHFYYDPGFKLQRLYLERTRTALLASDHVPLVAEFEV